MDPGVSRAPNAGSINSRAPPEGAGVKGAQGNRSAAVNRALTEKRAPNGMLPCVSVNTRNQRFRPQSVRAGRACAPVAGLGQVHPLAIPRCPLSVDVPALPTPGRCPTLPSGWLARSCRSHPRCAPHEQVRCPRGRDAQPWRRQCDVRRSPLPAPFFSHLHNDAWFLQERGIIRPTGAEHCRTDQ